jgi:hypothetical protein
MRKKVVHHCICGDGIGMQWFLRKSIVEKYQWTSVFQERATFTFEDACKILDDEFHEGFFNGICGIIIPETT